MESLTNLKRLLDNDYRIEKIQPPVFTSDPEVNIVTMIEEHHIKYKDPAKHKSELLKFAKLTHG
jgi:hypothetical protein